MSDSDLIFDLLAGDCDESPSLPSSSINEQDAELDLRVQQATNPITKGQSRSQIQAIFTGHEGLSERSEATALPSSRPPRASVPLHGQNNANTGIINEKPIHRSMAYMMAQGMNQTEIAERCGYSMGQVSQICRQQWFRDMVTAEIDAAGRDQVTTLLQSTTVDSIYKLIDLRDTAKNESVQAKCATELLDRVMGKAPQHIVQDVNVHSNDPVAELEKLEAELKVLSPSKQRNN